MQILVAGGDELVDLAGFLQSRNDSTAAWGREFDARAGSDIGSGDLCGALGLRVQDRSRTK